MEAVAGMFIVLIVFYLLMMAFALVSYIFQSLGLYTIAKRRGIHNPWLAWIPIGSSWLLGSISDQYQYVVKRKEKSKRKILLTLDIVTMVLAVAMVVCWVWMFGNTLFDALQSGGAMLDEEAILADMMVPLMVFYGISMVASVVSIVSMVFIYIALYDLYTSCNPENSVLFLVLSIFFSVAQPFLLFASRNKDLGMPPRQPQYYQPPVYQPPVYQPPVYQPPVQPTVLPEQPPVEPWEQKDDE